MTVLKTAIVGACLGFAMAKYGSSQGLSRRSNTGEPRGTPEPFLGHVSVIDTYPVVAANAPAPDALKQLDPVIAPLKAAAADAAAPPTLATEGAALVHNVRQEAAVRHEIGLLRERVGFQEKGLKELSAAVNDMKSELRKVHLALRKHFDAAANAGTTAVKKGAGCRRGRFGWRCAKRAWVTFVRAHTTPGQRRALKWVSVAAMIGFVVVSSYHMVRVIQEGGRPRDASHRSMTVSTVLRETVSAVRTSAVYWWQAAKRAVTTRQSAQQQQQQVPVMPPIARCADDDDDSSVGCGTARAAAAGASVPPPPSCGSPAAAAAQTSSSRGSSTVLQAQQPLQAGMSYLCVIDDNGVAHLVPTQSA